MILQPTSGHISRGNANIKRYMHPNVHAALFTTTETGKQHGSIDNGWIRQRRRGACIQQNTAYHQKRVT